MVVGNQSFVVLSVACTPLLFAKIRCWSLCLLVCFDFLFIYQKFNTTLLVHMLINLMVSCLNIFNLYWCLQSVRLHVFFLQKIQITLHIYTGHYFVYLFCLCVEFYCILYSYQLSAILQVRHFSHALRKAQAICILLICSRCQLSTH